jgi:hypothetical protein
VMPVTPVSLYDDDLEENDDHIDEPQA